MKNADKTYSEIFNNCSARFDLGAPGVAAECIEELYRATGATAAPRDRMVLAAVSVGIVLGLAFGFERSGYLWGPIGAALGVVFGSVGGAFSGFILRAATTPFVRPEIEALRLVRLGRYKDAVRSFRRAGKLVWRSRNVFERVAQLILAPIGIGRSDLPPDVALSNLAACEGILAESVGDAEETIDAYLRALSLWRRHTFVLASLIEFVIREGVWERSSEIANATSEFLEKTRDRRTALWVKGRLDAFQAALPTIDAKTYEPVPNAGSADAPPAFFGGITCRIIENPGGEISNGSIIFGKDGTKNP